MTKYASKIHPKTRWINGVDFCKKDFGFCTVCIRVGGTPENGFGPPAFIDDIRAARGLASAGGMVSSEIPAGMDIPGGNPPLRRAFIICACSSANIGELRAVSERDDDDDEVFLMFWVVVWGVDSTGSSPTNFSIPVLLG